MDVKCRWYGSTFPALDTVDDVFGCVGTSQQLVRSWCLEVSFVVLTVKGRNEAILAIVATIPVDPTGTVPGTICTCTVTGTCQTATKGWQLAHLFLFKRVSW